MLESESPEGHDTINEREPGDGAPASHSGKRRVAGESEIPGYDSSLADDIAAAFEDGKTYAQAELAFQKSRAAFAAHELKAGMGFAMLMLAFLHLALMGLVVGLIIALTPLVGAFVSIAIVVGVLAFGTAIFGWLAMRRFRKISGAFDSTPGEQGR